MNLLERLQEDMKGAMRSGDTITRDTLRLAISALKNRKIEARKDLDEADELAVLAKQVKSREDSAEQYAAAGRNDLEEKERAEIEVLKRYLPQLMSEDDTRSLVEGLIAELGLSSRKEMGQIMKHVMAEHRGKVDGKLVQKLAGELLS